MPEVTVLTSVEFRRYSSDNPNFVELYTQKMFEPSRLKDVVKVSDQVTADKVYLYSIPIRNPKTDETLRISIPDNLDREILIQVFECLNNETKLVESLRRSLESERYTVRRLQSEYVAMSSKLHEFAEAGFFKRLKYLIFGEI